MLVVHLTAVCARLAEALLLPVETEHVITESRVVRVLQIVVHVLREEAAEMVLVVQVNPVQAVRLTAVHARSGRYARGLR